MKPTIFVLITILSAGFIGSLLTGCATPKEKANCVLFDTKNDLEVCDFNQATIILSKGGQTFVAKPAKPAPAPSPTPSPSPAPEALKNKNDASKNATKKTTK